MLSLGAVRAPDDPEERTQMLTEMLLLGGERDGGEGGVAGAAVVYVTLQRTAVEVAEALVAAGLDARPYHAGLPALQREVRSIGRTGELVFRDRAKLRTLESPIIHVPRSWWL